ncbi:MAG TPA: family 16 glycoside hydrolase, partial [Gemmataceae bacterium]|nr:family 16 glycoside hydrolase [Gemmataceae bacterium]
NVASGTWYTQEVVAEGNRLRVMVNDKVLADATDGEYSEGFLGLEIINRVQGEIRFRKIEVKELPAPEPWWVPLFNGKDLTGWQEFAAGRGSWKVENGVLVGSGKPSHLFTQRGDFANFHLRMETRVRKAGPKAGAFGVFGRVPFENPRTLLSPFGRENLYKIPVPKLYDDAAPPPEPAPPSYREQPLVVWGADTRGEKTQTRSMPADEWFTSEFVLDGANGSLQTTTKIPNGSHTANSLFLAVKPASGHLALQLFDDWSVVEFRKIEVKELPPPKPAAPQPVVLRKFDPAKDKPAPLWGDAKPVTVEDGAFRIENDTNKGNFKALFDTILDGIPKDGLIVFRAKVKVKANDKLAWGGLQLGIGSPSFHNYDWPAHLGEYHGDVPEWTQKEVRYPASAFHQKNPPSIPVYVGLNANGVVWVKDAEVLHIPEGAKPEPVKVSSEPVKLRSFDPTTDKPLLGAGSDAKGITVEDGAWRVETGAGVKAFHLILGSLVDGIPKDGLLVFRAKVKVKGSHKDTWGGLQINFAGPSFHNYDWPAHLGEYHGDVPEWTQKEVRYPAAAFHKKTPPTVTMSASLYEGVLWLKDAELWHVPEGAKLDAAKENAALPPLRDAVAAKTATLDLTKKRLDAGKVSKIELLRAEAEVAEARAAVAEAEGDAAAVVARLEELVKARQEERDLMALRVEKGADPPDVLNQLDAKLAEAKVRLAKVKK